MKLNIKIRIFILLFIVFEVIHADYQGNLPDHYPKFLKSGPYAQNFQAAKSSYSSGHSSGTKTYTKTHTKTGRSNTKNLGSYAQQYTNTGGCQGTPRPPMNSHIRCSLNNCNATCLSGFKFPDGQNRLFLACKNNVWTVVRPDWLGVSVGERYDVIPASCEPICDPPCENNGICYEPNKCNCPENYSGNRCQDHRKPCLNYPTLPMNARRTCSSTQCTVTCLKGHNFPDGSAIANLKCLEGSWLPTREDWSYLPDCMPNCNPPCLNGGNCLSLNTCQCPQDFRGPQCQYRADICSVKKLGFNGGYNCSGNQDTFSCSLNCPIGIQFEFSPSQFYTCRFDTGIFQPQPIPQCIFNSNIEIFQLEHSNDTYYSHEFEHIKKSNLYSSLNHQIGIKSLKNNTLKTIENNLPRPGLCSYWSAQHVRTFDGAVFSAISDCAHVLVRDREENSFSIVVAPNNGCKQQTIPSDCSRTIYLYVGEKEYILKNSEMGNPVLYGPGGKKLPLPGAISGLRTILQAHHIILVLDNLGIALKWDTKNLIQISVSESFWNRTEGLCGSLDGYKTNDLQTKDGQDAKTIANFVDSWKLNLLDDVCVSPVRDTFSCSLVSKTLASRAHQYCNQILNDNRFSKCLDYLDISQFLEACQSDFCNCGDPGSNPGQCSCQTIEVFAEECKKQMKNGDVLQWRDDETCPMQCSGGRIYVACSTSSLQPTCGSEIIEDNTAQNLNHNLNQNYQCIEGCFCPKGFVLHAGQCISPSVCPCTLRGREFKPGTQIPKECNTCTCESGKWVCTQIECGSRCSAIGDPHYETFDGKRYDFMGQCRYYLVKSSNFSIEAENVACAGSISQNMNYPVNIASGLPSCTRSVTIKTSTNHLIRLKQNQEVIVDGHDVTRLPYIVGETGDVIRVASSLFIVVELENGVQVWWDGISRVYIDAPPTLRGHTRGLCGTFNANQKDEFLTPEGDIENDPIIFANQWKVDENCKDVQPSLKDDHPCELNIHNKQKAEKYCSILQSKIFAKCHWLLDPKPFYENCLYDMCSCETKTSDCLCATLGAYGTSCASLGAGVPWRIDVPECAIQCPVGQTYQFCGNSCSRTCQDISTRSNCKNICIEGCNCKDMEALNDENQCVPISECGCYENGIKFPPNYKEIRQNIVQELCTCLNGIWNCRVATKEEINNHPLQNNRQSICPIAKNQEFTTCEPEPITCKNMHYSLFGTSENIFGTSEAVCRPGCKCKAGYVLQDSFTGSGNCIKPEECPCHHGGQSYKENQTIMNDCNKCVCNSGHWSCEKNLCSGTCTTWGDSHFTTFDDKDFDYQGQCDYVFTKGSFGQHDSFEVIVQNVPCGSLGVSCTKAITITIAGETIILEKDRKIPDLKLLKRVTVRQTNLYVIVEAQSLGLTIIWDKGTRLSVKVDPRWQNRVKGLCGNYNQDPTDDFQTPSGGFIEINPIIFGDSWQIDKNCQKAVEILDTCALRPERKGWALKKCGLLKSDLFRACHSAVQVDRFLERCIFDTCACDKGGDCECLCTALAAYAQECNQKGIAIKWRSQKLCPMQCDETCSSYSPCISTCPLETCDNIISHPKIGFGCQDDTCIEGCQPKICPTGQIYLNNSAIECVPKNTCKPICMELDNKIYSEGDLIEEDDCHKCFCSNFKKICTGKPCHKNVTIVPNEQQLKCISGWSVWVNSDRSKSSQKKGKKIDVEPIPTAIVLNSFAEGGRCSIEKMTDIQCRTTLGNIDYKATNLDVECSLEHGLICKNSKKNLCPDFEIRVLCQCEKIQQSSKPETMFCDDNTYRKHDYDCHLFYQCSNNQLVEKTCGPNMYFNPDTQICDWPQNVQNIRPNCSELESNLQNKPIFVVPKLEQADLEHLNDSICPPNYKYSLCGTECNRLCMYYDHVVKTKGHCLTGSACEAGCVSANRKLACPIGHLWRDNTTCVEIKDCLCVSKNGDPVAPGTINKESDCLICQCIDNNYICQNSCTTTNPILETTISPNFTGPEVLPEFETQPEVCLPDHLHSIFNQNPQIRETSFTSSSKINEYHQPWFAEMNAQLPALSAGSWQPEVDSPEEYIQVDLLHPEPVYQIILMGHPIYDFYVTSFYVMYTLEQKPVNFRYAKTQSGLPQLFRGNVDHVTAIKNVFEVPFEARFVKIIPKTWHNHIALRFDLIGCTPTSEYYVTTELPIHITTPNLEMMCDEPMGVEQEILPQDLIKVSSEKVPDLEYFGLKINGLNSWQPLTNTPNEFVLFDFTSPKQLTGVKTQGGQNGWVQSYQLQYSKDNLIFTPILDDFGSDKLFPANFDQDTIYKNVFSRPIRAQYLKLIPKKWTNNIQMRVEPLGCFEPYPTRPPVATVLPEQEEPNLGCNHCPGTLPPVSETLNNVCVCDNQKYFDGNSCISRYECPCKINELTYKVGTIFETTECQECLCVIGGTSQCSPKKCPPCDKGLRPISGKNCECFCEPCPIGQILCPTSNICIKIDQWCDGIVDCSDDETSCESSTIEPLITTKKYEQQQCPPLICPKGFKIVLQKNEQQDVSPMFQMYGGRKQKLSTNQITAKYFGTKGRTIAQRVHTKTLPRKPIKTLQKHKQACVQFICQPETVDVCPEPRCPPGYSIVYDKHETMETCQTYECKPPNIQDDICNITGRNFKTFDNFEYKYDICNHILARDLAMEEWDLLLTKKCGEICIKILTIRHGNQIIKIYPDLSIEFNGYKYTAEQTSKIGAKNLAFTVSKMGNTLLFVSNHYGFWTMFNTQSNIKVGITEKLSGQVDGLCGFYDNNPKNDKRKPNGSQAKTSAQFGDSWLVQSDNPELCETKTCSLQIQNQAFKMCEKVKNQILAPCHHAIEDIDAWISRCLETTCQCLEQKTTNNTLELETTCGCTVLESFVVDCVTARPNVALEDWRMTLECPSNCPPNMVPNDCYRRRCELSCSNLAEVDSCPILPNLCFPGCYCPPGLVRKGTDKCVPPKECRDCECNILPHLEFVTYDGKTYNANTNCTYIMAREKLVQNDGTEREFQVFVTNDNCPNNPQKLCTSALNLIVNNHRIEITRNKNPHDDFIVHIDDYKLDKLPFDNGWTEVTRMVQRHVNIIIPKLQIELRAYYPTLGASLRVPSLSYQGRLEGICGDCDRNPENDLLGPNNDPIVDPKKFLDSWRGPRPGHNNSDAICTEEEVKECPELKGPDGKDPCLTLLDPDRFGKCHMLLDPAIFLSTCYHETCNNKPESACSSIQTYALGCRAMGVCLDYHTDLCPPKTCPPEADYQLCGPPCPKTCENPKGCTKGVPKEGCFCPEGLVLKNNSQCVPERLCYPCDDLGHFPGDNWESDPCTKCTCDVTSRSVKCETTACPAMDTVCEAGFDSVKIKTAQECCEKFICVKANTTKKNCTDPQPLNCGLNQQRKLEPRPDGCVAFVCQCVPKSECLELNLNEPLSDVGYEWFRNDSGCCPTLDKVCKVEKCPPEPKCNKFYTLEVQETNCCPEYKCEPPKNGCIFTQSYTTSELGGERALSSLESITMLLKEDETYNDGPCRNCKCSKVTNTYTTSCTVSECSKPSDLTDSKDFVLEEVWTKGQCCPRFKKTACRHNSGIRAPGEKWPLDPINSPCTILECLKGSTDLEDVSIVTHEVTCDKDCSPGNTYFPATGSGECCGSCKQTSCVLDGIEKTIDSQWLSDDFCTEYKCVQDNGTIFVQKKDVICDKPNEELQKQYIYSYTPQPNNCCGTFTPVSCLVDGTSQHVGSTWPDPMGDPCVTVTCLHTETGNLVQQRVQEKCNTECRQGWKYRESGSPDICCGNCVQVSCISNSTEYLPGDTWSSADGCTSFECTKSSDGTLSVRTYSQSCPDVSNCPETKIFNDGCCLKCNLTIEDLKASCEPVPISIEQTIGLITQTNKEHGQCKNLDSISNFTECRGQCSSGTFFNQRTVSHENNCKCCTAIKYTGLPIEMVCLDGYTYKKTIAVPSECTCQNCSANETNKNVKG